MRVRVIGAGVAGLTAGFEFARRTGECEEIGSNRITMLEPDLAERFPRALFFPREAHLTPASRSMRSSSASSR